MVRNHAQSPRPAKSDLIHRLGFLYGFDSDSSTACLRTKSGKCPTFEIVRASASLSLLGCSIMMLQIKLGISPNHCAENQYKLVPLNHEQRTFPIRLHLLFYIIDTVVEAHVEVQRPQCSHHGLPHQRRLPFRRTKVRTRSKHSPNARRGVNTRACGDTRGY